MSYEMSLDDYESYAAQEYDSNKPEEHQTLTMQCESDNSQSSDAGNTATTNEEKEAPSKSTWKQAKDIYKTSNEVMREHSILNWVGGAAVGYAFGKGFK